MNKQFPSKYLPLTWFPSQVNDSSSALKELEGVLGISLGDIIPGTIEVQPQHALPEDSLRSYLSRTLHLQDEGEFVLKKFKHGQSNPTYYVKFGGKELVLRKKPVSCSRQLFLYQVKLRYCIFHFVSISPHLQKKPNCKKISKSMGKGH